MSDLRELYQEVILDHTKSPRNFGRLENPSHSAEGHNPLCGDHFALTLEIADDRVRQILFEGSGCSISTASASLMTQMIKGNTTNAADALFEKFHEVLRPQARKDVLRGVVEPLHLRRPGLR